MKRFTQLLIATSMVLALAATSWAQDQTQIKERTQSRIEARIQNANGNAALSQNRVNARYQFQDKNGDGVCDYFQDGGKLGKGSKGGYGPGDGTGNMGIGPKDGTGFGPGSGSGTGICDDTGPKGKTGNRAGRR
jgi:hypothetical protein